MARWLLSPRSRTHRIPALLAFTMLMLVHPPLSRGGDTTTMQLQAGVYFVRFTLLPADTSPQSLLGSQLPGGDSWKTSTRLVTAEAPKVLGTYYDSGKQTWVGTLDTLTLNQGYWLVLPPSTGTVTLVLDSARFEAGSAQNPSGGLLVGTNGGYTTVTPAPPPQSSASYEVVTKPVTTLGGSSKVYIQNPPSPVSPAAPVHPSAPSAPSTPGVPGGNPVPWVKVKLDTIWGHGAQEAWVPLAGGGTVTVPPPPSFDRPPWGDGPPPEKP